MIITIDGPAGSGKGTLAINIAKHYNLAHMDTGLLYRAVGIQMLAHNQPLNDEAIAKKYAEEINYQTLTDPALRSEEASNAASMISAFPEVRSTLLDTQRKFAHSPPPEYKGAVLDGRDLGSYVLPEADVKFFVTANIEIRAKRRLKQLQNMGIKSIYTAVLKDLMERDLRDGKRKVAPLKQTNDAYLIDTSHISPQEVLEDVMHLVDKKLLSKMKR